MHADPPNERLRVVAVNEEQLEGVQHHQYELDHLDSGEVFLPPKEFLVSGSQGRQQIVGVHDDVDEGVKEAEEGGMAAGGELDAEPNGHWHHAVVDHVECGDVVVLFPQDEENLHKHTKLKRLLLVVLFCAYRIEKFGEFREIVPPTASSHLKSKERCVRRFGRN